ncbi:MAG: hypothetical protein ACI8S6_004734, partial [Myxococcota bacterium]
MSEEGDTMVLMWLAAAQAETVNYGSLRAGTVIYS